MQTAYLLSVFDCEHGCQSAGRTGVAEKQTGIFSVGPFPFYQIPERKTVEGKKSKAEHQDDADR